MIQSQGAHVPEDKVQYYVQTPYGRGLTIRTRQESSDSTASVAMREIQLVDWKPSSNMTQKTDAPSIPPQPSHEVSSQIQKAATLESSASSRPPSINNTATLYSPVDFPSVAPQIGDEVMTQYGRGTVEEIKLRDNDSIHQVRISSWRLADRNHVVCYLNHNSVRVVRKKRLYEMTVYEKVEYAQLLKHKATAQFGAKSYSEALELYSKSIEAVRYVQHSKSSNNCVRADLLFVLITCSNNAATCCIQTKKWQQANDFAQNALALLSALEKGQSKSSRIQTILLHDHSLDKSKLYGQWPCKSYLVKARAQIMGLGDYDEALKDLRKAQACLDEYCEVGNSGALAKEIKFLTAHVKDRQKSLLQKEKARAKAMFGQKGTKENDRLLANGNNPTPSPTIGNTLKKQSKPILMKPKQQSSPLSSSNRRVSFSEKLVSHREIPHKDDIEHHVEELEWYQDVDFLIGLSLFGGAAVAAAFGTAILIKAMSRSPTV